MRVLITISLFFLSINIKAQVEKVYLIEWKKNLTSKQESTALRLLKKYGKEIQKDAWNAKLSGELAHKLSKTNAFQYIEVEKIHQVIKPEINLDIQNKGNQNWYKDWHVNRVNAPKAWTITQGSKQVTVAVCDSGVNASLSELKGKILPGWNFIDGNSDTSPNTNHGTAVTGFIAADNSNNYGTAGVAPKVKILPGKIVTTGGGVPTRAMLGCIRWAADKGAKVINVSMTGVNASSSASAARYANQKGAMVVWAAGNQNWKTSWKDKKEIVAVGATDIDDRRYYSRSYGSNTGKFVDITAPGEDVYHLNRNGSFGRGNGTSYSAPIVTGVAALIYSLNPNFTPEQVLYYLQKGAQNMGNRNSFGAGMADAYESLRLALQDLN